MFIQTEVSSDPDVVRFLPGKAVLEGEEEVFSDPASAVRSPLASRLFDIESVAEVRFGGDFIGVTKLKDGDWQLMKPAILGAIMEHYVASLPMITDDEVEAEEDLIPWTRSSLRKSRNCSLPECARQLQKAVAT